MASRTPNVLLSASNEFDNLARYMHHVELNWQLPQQQLLMELPVNVVEVQDSRNDEPRDTDNFDELPEPSDD